MTKGFTQNYFNEAEQEYAALAAITKVKDLPSGILDKALLVSPINQPRFRRDLEEDARQAGYSAGDPRILDLAHKRIEAGWYGGFSLYSLATQDYAKMLQGDVFHPGEAPWYIVGETYTRRGDMPGEQIATSGSPKLTAAVAPEPITATPVIDHALDKLLKTPGAEEAVERLDLEGISMDAVNLQDMMDFLAAEENK